MLKWISGLLGLTQNDENANRPPETVDGLTTLVEVGTVVGEDTPVATTTGDPEELRKKCGLGVVYEDGEILAARHGVLALRSGKVAVLPLVRISQDRLQALPTAEAFGDGVKPSDVRRALLAAGVAIPIEAGPIRDALRSKEAVPLVRGTQPVSATPPRLELKIETELATCKQSAAGSVDFRKRSLDSTMVRRDDEIAELHPGTAGSKGNDLFGNVIEPTGTSEQDTTEAGDGVRVEGNHYFADVGGRVTYDRGVLCVEPVVCIDGDVDYHSGNVNAASLGVDIGGDVRAEFEVIAGGRITVKGSVENALVRSGGDVNVGGGLICPHGGSTTARGGVIAKFTNSAKVRAIGDIEVPGGITTSEIHSASHVTASGRRGCIVGGIVSAAAGITVNRAGSPGGVKTYLRIQTPEQTCAHIDIILEPLLARLATLAGVLGEGAESWNAADVPEQLNDDYKEYMQIFRGVADLEERNEALHGDYSLGGVIRVEGIAHPGVTIDIHGSHLELQDAMKKVEFFYDTELEAVAHRSIVR